MTGMTTVDLPLLPLGRGTDLTAERGVECPGDLPAPSDPDLVERARAAIESGAAKAKLAQFVAFGQSAT